jgi:hypothetical protein
VKLTDMSFDDAGAIVGTPAYMSPEQADPTSLDIDTRTDVYALGVILYELLVGLPPLDVKHFRRGAIVEMLRMVREVEPMRPSARLVLPEVPGQVAANRGTELGKLSRSLRGELDWIVMKALEKDRTRRYDSANGLGRDVQRYLADELVEARPPSAAYRLKKFVRRHRGEVVAASLVILVLVAGIVGTTLGLIQARENAATAMTARNDALEAGNELARVNADLKASREKLLTGMARHLLHPLGSQVRVDQPVPPLNAQEAEPLLELASSTDEDLRSRFVEVALSDPALLRRLGDRSGYALHAAVGLDSSRRARVEELLRSHLERGDLSRDQQEQTAICLIQLGSRDSAMTEKTADTILRAMKDTANPWSLHQLAESIALVSARMGPERAAEVTGQAILLLSRALSKTTETKASQALSESLAVLSARIEPREAAEAAAIFAGEMGATTAPGSLRTQVTGLSTVASRLRPGKAAELSAVLTHTISKTTDPNVLRALTDGLSAIAPRLEASAADSAAAVLEECSKKATDPNAIFVLTSGLAAVAARMEPAKADEACGRTAGILVPAILKNTNPRTRVLLIESLGVTLTRMAPRHAVAILLEAMTRTGSGQPMLSLTQHLCANSERLEEKEARDVYGQAASILMQGIAKTDNSVLVQPLTLGLTLVSARLDPQQAGENTVALTRIIAGHKDPGSLLPLAHCLSAVSARLTPKDAGAVAAILSGMVARTADPRGLQGLAHAVAAVSARLEPAEGSRVCRDMAQALTQAISKATTPQTMAPLVDGLKNLAPRLDPKDAGEAAAALAQAIIRSTRSKGQIVPLLGTLSALNASLAREQASELAATFEQALTETADPTATLTLANCLSIVSVRLEPKQVRESAATFVRILGKTKDPAALQSLTQGLARIALHLEANEAAAIITRTLADARDPLTRQRLAEALATLSNRLDGRDAAVLCGQAAAVLSEALENHGLQLGADARPGSGSDIAQARAAAGRGDRRSAHRDPEQDLVSGHHEITCRKPDERCQAAG